VVVNWWFDTLPLCITNSCYWKFSDNPIFILILITCVVPKEFQKITYPEVFQKKEDNRPTLVLSSALPGFHPRDNTRIIPVFVCDKDTYFCPARQRELYVCKEIQSQLGLAVRVLCVRVLWAPLCCDRKAFGCVSGANFFLFTFFFESFVEAMADEDYNDYDGGDVG
jgi:hypothetical protein